MTRVRQATAYFALTAAVFLLTLSAGFADETHSSRTRTYQGAWFTVKYPADFHVSPGQRSSSSTTGYDSASFTSPDNTVQFYTFSPQWNGDPHFCRIDPQREVLVSRSTEKQGDRIAMRTIRREMVRARDGGYTRAWEDSESTLNTRLVFGIRYRSAAALARYRPEYLAFKKSLIQFAD